MTHKEYMLSLKKEIAPLRKKAKEQALFLYKSGIDLPTIEKVLRRIYPNVLRDILPAQDCAPFYAKEKIFAKRRLRRRKKEAAALKNPMPPQGAPSGLSSDKSSGPAPPENPF